MRAVLIAALSIGAALIIGKVGLDVILALPRIAAQAEALRGW